jgi:hypothetical protein
MFFNSALEESGTTNTYNISWYAPAKGITISSLNSFYFLGCDFDVDLFDSMRNPIGTCMSRCHGEVSLNQGPCYGIGCCSISLRKEISGFQGTIARVGNTDPLHTDIMALMSGNGDYYTRDGVTDLFSEIDDHVTLEVAIMDQPSCKSAQMNKASYACGGTNGYCANASYGGYTCHCHNEYYDPSSAYLSEGCMQGDLPACFSLKKREKENINFLSS